MVSIPSNGRAVLDAGSKTLTSNLVGPPLPGKGYGYGNGYREITIACLTEEHGGLALEDGKSRLRIGLEVITNHICPVVKLADVMYLMKGVECHKPLEVLARGNNR